MTTFTAPPDATHRVLYGGDILNVLSNGHSHNTVLQGGIENVYGDSNGTKIYQGTENVEGGGIANNTQLGGFGRVTPTPTLNVLNGGTAFHAEVDSGGIVNVEKGGIATGTFVYGGIQNLYGTATGTDVTHGGTENVYGVSNDPTIDVGFEHVYSGGTVNNVTFGHDPLTQNRGGQLLLTTPSELTGTIKHFAVGDIIDFLNTTVTVTENRAHHTVTVTYGNGQTTTYGLEAEQHDTKFTTISDNHGGTDLILIGVAPHSNVGLLV